MKSRFAINMLSLRKPVIFFGIPLCLHVEILRLYVTAPNNGLVSLELPEESSLKVAEIYLVNMYGEKV